MENKELQKKKSIFYKPYKITYIRFTEELNNETIKKKMKFIIKLMNKNNL